MLMTLPQWYAITLGSLLMWSDRGVKSAVIYAVVCTAVVWAANYIDQCMSWPDRITIALLLAVLAVSVYCFVRLFS
jgi:hypothetical protein